MITLRLNKLILKKNECFIAGGNLNVKGIMVHSTGANNPYLSRYVNPDDGLLGANTYNNSWNTPRPDGRQVCVHAFIGRLKDGSIATYQTLPWDMRGWHGGSGKKGSVNDTHIGFEICEDDLTDPVYFKGVYIEAAELCAYLCGLFHLTEKDVICHSEGYRLEIASNHGDVMHWFPKHNKNMDDFRALVKSLLTTESKNAEKNASENENKYYRVQTGAFSVKANAENMAGELRSIGFEACTIFQDQIWKVQLGAFRDKLNAERLQENVKNKGYDSFLVFF